MSPDATSQQQQNEIHWHVIRLQFAVLLSTTPTTLAAATRTTPTMKTSTNTIPKKGNKQKTWQESPMCNSRTMQLTHLQQSHHATDAPAIVTPRTWRMCNSHYMQLTHVQQSHRAESTNTPVVFQIGVFLCALSISLLLHWSKRQVTVASRVWMTSSHATCSFWMKGSLLQLFWHTILLPFQNTLMETGVVTFALYSYKRFSCICVLSFVRFSNILLLCLREFIDGSEWTRNSTAIVVAHVGSCLENRPQPASKQLIQRTAHSQRWNSLSKEQTTVSVETAYLKNRRQSALKQLI